jgi:hypothetical protein
MEALRFWLSLGGVVLFAACAMALVVGFVAKSFALEGLAWIEPLLGLWLFGALLLVLLLRWTVIRLQWTGA